MAQKLVFIILDRIHGYFTTDVRIEISSIESFEYDQERQTTTVVTKSGKIMSVKESVEEIVAKLKKAVTPGYSEPDPYEEY